MRVGDEAAATAFRATTAFWAAKAVKHQQQLLCEKPRE